MPYSINSMKNLAVTSLVFLLGSCLVAQATFHLWQIDEVYSNNSGTVQFIELTTNASGQNFVSGHNVTTTSDSFIFGSNLSGNTANTFLLLATPGYFALHGVPVADYNLGANNFFNIAGDTINFAGVNTFTFTNGQLPHDGIHSLNRAFNTTAITIGVNSPHNFTGSSGSISIPEPATVVLAAAAFGVALVVKRRKGV